MAIENVWIIDLNSGICIYDWYHESKEKTIDEQLVSGLLLAFRNFSSEAGLVDISAIEGLDRKLAYKTDDRFIIAAICHSKDYEPLINKTLLDILKMFRQKYEDILKDSTTDVSPFRTFDEVLVERLKGTVAARTVISTLSGAITSMVTIGLFFIAYYFLIGIIKSAIPNGGNIVGLIILLIGFIIAGFVGGLIAGERKFGIIASFVSVILIFVLFVAFFSREWETLTELVFNSILFFLLFSIMAFTGGLLGGYLKERRYFYPITELEAEETD
ncbi:MAG: hypothetical protein DRP02_14140 [Candidatus Gerdarchaeota archaeon]|nr:MAG: hypothetical protein DRP02_14140 [Candidatus Gerdarchaeota archaeon]